MALLEMILKIPLAFYPQSLSSQIVCLQGNPSLLASMEDCVCLK